LQVELDRDSRTPLYQQIYDIWRQRIESGDVRPGERIPTERELCDIYEVSQITVRQAIQMLVIEGLLVRRPRTGTRVAHRKFSQDLIRLTSFSEDMRSRGLRPGGMVIRACEETADIRVAEKLKLRDSATVTRLERLRLAEDEPMAIETCHIPVALCPGLAERDLEGVSLYDLLRSEYRLDVQWAQQSLEASSATSAEARLLGIKRGAPVLRTERLTFDSAGRPVEFAVSVYRGDRYKLNVQMRRA
jgi:GntR family transcriptional regulator